MPRSRSSARSRASPDQFGVSRSPCASRTTSKRPDPGWSISPERSIRRRTPRRRRCRSTSCIDTLCPATDRSTQSRRPERTETLACSRKSWARASGPLSCSGSSLSPRISRLPSGCLITISDAPCTVSAEGRNAVLRMEAQGSMRTSSDSKRASARSPCPGWGSKRVTPRRVKRGLMPSHRASIESIDTR